MIKHPLIKKEWKGVGLIGLAFTLLYTFLLLVLSNGIYNSRVSVLFYEKDIIFMEEIYTISRFLVPISLVGIIILVVMLFNHDRNISTSKFIATLPYSKKEQFSIKYMVGLLTFTIPFLLFTLVSFKIRSSNIYWIERLYKYLPTGEHGFKMDSVGKFLKWALLVWLIMIAFYTFLFFIQTIMGQNIISGVVGSLIWLSPWYLIVSIIVNIQIIFHTDTLQSYKIGEILSVLFAGIPSRRWGDSQKILSTMPRYGQNTSVYVSYSYDNILIYIIGLIVVTAAGYILGKYFYQNNDVEKNGEIVMFDWFKKVLVIGVTICSALLIPLLFAVITQIQSSIITIVLIAIGAYIGYILSYRGIEISKKH